MYGDDVVRMGQFKLAAVLNTTGCGVCCADVGRDCENGGGGVHRQRLEAYSEIMARARPGRADVQAMMARPVPQEIVILAAACPDCRAVRGKPCRATDGAVRGAVHEGRWQAYSRRGE